MFRCRESAARFHFKTVEPLVGEHLAVDSSPSKVMCLWSSVSTTAGFPGCKMSLPRTVAPPGASTAHSAAPASTANPQTDSHCFYSNRWGRSPTPTRQQRAPARPSRILRAGAIRQRCRSVGAELVRRDTHRRLPWLLRTTNPVILQVQGQRPSAFAGHCATIRCASPSAAPRGRES